MSIAASLIGVSVVGTAVAHISFRGRSLRDAFRRPHVGIELGFRVTPGLSKQLESRDIVGLIEDCPHSVSTLKIHRVAPGGLGSLEESISRGISADRQDWVELVAMIDHPAGVEEPSGTDRADAAVAATAEFLAHRLMLLGTRARRLENLPTSPATVELRRSGGAPMLARTPHLWFTKARSIELPPPASIVLGIGETGRPVTMRLGEVPLLHVLISGAAAQKGIESVILAALQAGYRVGIRTLRQPYFAAMLAAGAVLVPSQGDPTIDCLVLDVGCDDVDALQARVIRLQDSPRACTATGFVPYLEFQDYVWLLHTARSITTIKPLQPIAWPASSATPEFPESNPATSAVPGRAQAPEPVRAPGRGRAADLLSREAWASERQ